jgi:hypothetical protein
MTATLNRTAARCATSANSWAWESDDPDAQQYAVSHCALCQLRAGCLRTAVATGDASRVWGGLRPAQLRELIAARPKAHDRSCATSGRCHCRQGKAAHAAYMRAWRAQSRNVTRAFRISVVVLDAATGRGKHRAFPGQTALEIGGKR